jgi:predicted amidohydrolase YtcJ
MRKTVAYIFLFHLFFSSGGFAQMKTKADLILINGKVYTLDMGSGIAEAFAVKNGVFIAIGTTDQIVKRYAADSVIDAAGKPVFPGFIDAHSHFFGYALGLRELDLKGLQSFEEVVSLVAAQKDAFPGEWITGRGWDQNLWTGKEFPDRMQLDILFPDRPVVLIRVDGHSLVANGEALERAGIGKDNSFLPGEVEVKEGRLTGILSENAADHMRNSIPLPSLKDQRILLQKAQANCFAAGLTGVADAGLDFPVVHMIDSLQQEGVLKIRIYAMLNPTDENILNFVREGQYITPRLTVRSIKLYADGSLGSRTALLKSPYYDDTLKSGILVTPRDRIRDLCQLALNSGYQVNTHAIGDSAIGLILGIYTRMLKGKNDLRWRIEHAQVVDPRDISMFGDYSIIPSVQATHATSDMYWAPDRLGKKRIRWAYAYKNLLDQNGWLANGTDFPIEKISPLLTFYASVARQDLKGYPAEGFQMENVLSRDEALRSVTIWAAKAGFDELSRGSIVRGKMADFIILDHDIMNCPVKEIPETRVVMTVVGGERVY